MCSDQIDLRRAEEAARQSRDELQKEADGKPKVMMDKTPETSSPNNPMDKVAEDLFDKKDG